MRFNVGLKLGFWFALFAILSTALTGYYVYHASRNLLTRAAEEKLLTATQVLARRIDYSLDESTNHLRFLASLPATAKLADRGLPATERHAEERKLEETFISLLKSHDEYFQIRIIGAANHGKELVRVDRDDVGIVAVHGDDLQEKGHFPYVYEALRLQDGGMYFSSINLNREQGAHKGLDKPTLRIATTIHGKDGSVFGIVVVNIDLEGMFERLRTDIPDDISVVLTNADGDYLVHPDPARTFGFDRGRSFRIQDDIPAITPVLDGSSDSRVLTIAGGDSGMRSVGAFVRVAYGDPAKPAFVIAGLRTPLAAVLRDSATLGIDILRIALALSMLAVVISLVLSRVLTQPLNAMAAAIGRFEAGKPVRGLPVGRKDEIGFLANSFLSMMARLNTQVGDLQSRQLQLDYLAHHDPLTRLPNRVLFLDRLVHAINKTQRNKRQFAVIFIDLDKFKEINDSLGHRIGDEALKLAAERMQSVLRQEDTISRLAGDEFTIIIEDLHHAAQSNVIAAKLVTLFKQPFVVEGNSFTLTCSIGISIYPRHGKRAEELLNKADAAMYSAKKSGRNTYRIYKSGDGAAEDAAAKS